MVRVSLVEVSPSMLTILKLLSAAACKAFCSMGVETAASVVKKLSMVPMLG